MVREKDGLFRPDRENNMVPEKERGLLLDDGKGRRRKGQKQAPPGVVCDGGGDGGGGGRSWEGRDLNQPGGGGDREGRGQKQPAGGVDWEGGSQKQPAGGGSCEGREKKQPGSSGRIRRSFRRGGNGVGWGGIEAPPSSVVEHEENGARESAWVVREFQARVEEARRREENERLMI